MVEFNSLVTQSLSQCQLLLATLFPQARQSEKSSVQQTSTITKSEGISINSLLPAGGMDNNSYTMAGETIEDVKSRPIRSSSGTGFITDQLLMFCCNG